TMSHTPTWTSLPPPELPYHLGLVNDEIGCVARVGTHTPRPQSVSGARDHQGVPAPLPRLLRVFAGPSRSGDHAAAAFGLPGTGLGERDIGRGPPRAPGSRLDRRRRAAGPVSRTGRAFAAAGPHGSRSAVGHQRRARDSGGVELD